MFDLFNTKKDKRTLIRKNAIQGKEGEDHAKTKDFWVDGWYSKKTRKGPDFIQERINFLTGKKEIRYKEVKTGNSKLSKVQKKEIAKLKKKGIPVVVERIKNSRDF